MKHGIAVRMGRAVRRVGPECAKLFRRADAHDHVALIDSTPHPTGQDRSLQWWLCAVYDLLSGGFGQIDSMGDTDKTANWIVGENIDKLKAAYAQGLSPRGAIADLRRGYGGEFPVVRMT
jgi:hypothetical protein